MKQTKHKILSVFLSVCMIISCMVGFSVTAYATDVSYTLKTDEYLDTEQYVQQGNMGYTEEELTMLENDKHIIKNVTLPYTFKLRDFGNVLNIVKFINGNVTSNNSAVTVGDMIGDIGAAGNDCYITINSATSDMITISFPVKLTNGVTYNGSLQFKMIADAVAVESVTLNKTSTTLTVGGTETLTATVAPEEVTDKTVTWSSDTPAVATVDSNGKVTAVAAGTANITATSNADNTKSATCEVTVNKADPTAPTDLTATYGETLDDVTLPTDWTWVDSSESVGDVGEHTFKANFAGDENFNAASDVDVTVTVSKADPEIPTGLTAKTGQTLANVSLPDGWSWVDAGTTSVGEVGNNTFSANYIDKTGNYNDKTDVKLTVTVSSSVTYTRVAAKAATCTATGNEEYYEGSDGKYYTKSGDTYTETTLAAVTIAKTAHTLTAVAAVNAKCTTDGTKAHYKCEVCEKLFEDEKGENEVTADDLTVKATGHTLTAVAAVDAKCTEDGTKAHYKCSVCEKLFEDADGKTETTADALKVAKLGHNFVDGKCTRCGETDPDYAAPAPAVTTTTTAAETTAPETTTAETTTTAAETTAPETTTTTEETTTAPETTTTADTTTAPETTFTGKTQLDVTVDADVSGTADGDLDLDTTVTIQKQSDDGAVNNTTPEESNLGGAALRDDANYLEDAVLTPEDKQAISDGATVDVYLEVSDTTPAPEEQQAIEEKVAENVAQNSGNTKSVAKVGFYFDASLFKSVGDRGAQAVHHTNGLVTIALEIPEAYINNDPHIIRTYRIARLHDGVVTILPCKFSRELGRLSFMSDYFSTYALVYEDTPIEEDNPVTGAPFHAEFAFAAACAAAAFLTTRKKKNNK